MWQWHYNCITIAQGRVFDWGACAAEPEKRVWRSPDNPCVHNHTQTYSRQITSRQRLDIPWSVNTVMAFRWRENDEMVTKEHRWQSIGLPLRTRGERCIQIEQTKGWASQRSRAHPGYSWLCLLLPLCLIWPQPHCSFQALANVKVRGPHLTVQKRDNLQPILCKLCVNWIH